MVIPWHGPVMEKFSNEEAVATVIMENTKADGVYILPNLFDSTADMQERTDAMKKGPIVFAAVQRNGSIIPKEEFF